jgi:hypothetical protein
LAQKDAANVAETETASLNDGTTAQQQPTEQFQTALSIVEPQGGYVSGTCKDLRASGVGSNFTPGDANYTPERDRDEDGVACES